MSKTAPKPPMTQQQRDHRTDQLDPNYGTNGTNPANGKVNGNRGQQLNPNRPARLMFGDREWIDHRQRAQSARLQGWCYNFEGLLAVVQGFPGR